MWLGKGDHENHLDKHLDKKEPENCQPSMRLILEGRSYMPLAYICFSKECHVAIYIFWPHSHNESSLMTDELIAAVYFAI
jgi:hypothetical protein